MSDFWGTALKIALFGESHGPAIGVVIHGLPAGMELDQERIDKEMARRAPGKSPLTTARKEQDQVEILSGVFQGRTTGTALAAMIRNGDSHSRDYDILRDLMRPGHADYPGRIKYRSWNDYRGGGHFSGRLTAPLVFAGALAKLFLEARGVRIGAHIASIGSLSDAPLDPVAPDMDALEGIQSAILPVLDAQQGEKMAQAIAEAKRAGDSLGGVVECAAVGLPVGLGEPFFGSLESCLSSLIFSIPAVKALSFGDGFGLAAMKGSEANDRYYFSGDQVRAATNHNGGILGGLSNGMALIFSAAIKPTASIARAQQTVNLSSQREEKLIVAGRHDPCIVPRALPVIEGACALALTDLWLSGEKTGGEGE